MKVIVIGGGAGGMMAAGIAGECGHEVILLERNEKLGKKLFITGKGRCNITNACSSREFLEHVVNNDKFLMGALNTFTPQDTIDFCERNGCKVKVERGNRVFPESDKSSDFIRCLERYVGANKVQVRLGCRVSSLVVEDNVIKGVQLDNGLKLMCDKVVLATGGKSYQLTGSSGDGYAIAKAVGHTIITPRPALVGIDTVENVAELAGVSLKNTTAKIIDKNGKVLCEEFGEMLFTHNGVSGPIILSLSSHINRMELNTVKLAIDLKPALNEETLDNRIIGDFNKYTNKEFKNALTDLLIGALRPIVIERSGIDADKKVNQITKEERLKLVRTLKGLEFGIARLGDIDGAIVTSGGINVKEISPKDMQSKLVRGLFFAGEVIDVDAVTGGFNIQIALSTGYLAGQGC